MSQVMQLFMCAMISVLNKVDQVLIKQLFYLINTFERLVTHLKMFGLGDNLWWLLWCNFMCYAEGFYCGVLKIFPDNSKIVLITCFIFKISV